jgi:3-methyladenine DNA glycosylase AlkD
VANANADLVRKYSRYFKEGYDAYGLSTEIIHNKVNELVNVRRVSLELVLQTSHILVPTGKYEETSFAYALLMEYKKHFTRDVFNEVGQWFDEGITNWGHTDVISSELIWAFLDMGVITPADLSDWRFSPHRFKRRAVPVSLIKPMKKSDDFAPFFELIDPMMPDPERVVHQGLGWFLREAWKKQPQPTEVFLLRWKETSARLIFQYATEKMTPEQKNRFKRTK